MLGRFTRLWRLSLLTAAAALGVAALPSAASASTCVPGPTAPVFAQFGDPAFYFLAPGGSFEGSLSWARSGPVSVVSGNEPFLLAGPLHTKSLRLGDDGSVTTPKFCVTHTCRTCASSRTRPAAASSTSRCACTTTTAR